MKNSNSRIKLESMLYQQLIKELDNNIDNNADKQVKKDPSRVIRFFKVLNSSAARQYMNFNTSYEKAMAIVKFAELIGVPKSQIPFILSYFRKMSNNTQNEQ